MTLPYPNMLCAFLLQYNYAQCYSLPGWKEIPIRAALDGTIQVTKEEAFEYAVRSAKEEGIFVGISSGASLAAVAKKLPEVPDGSTVLTICYDTGERYLSVEGLFG